MRRAIVEYARTHPRASDTLPGILQWWVPPDLSRSRAEAETVIDDLVAGGVLRRQRLIDGTELYSVPEGPAEGPGPEDPCTKR